VEGLLDAVGAGLVALDQAVGELVGDRAGRLEAGRDAPGGAIEERLRAQRDVLEGEAQGVLGAGPP
jgi:hypothetical protein